MKVFEAHISDFVVEKILPLLDSNLDICNQKFQDFCGVIDFFQTEIDLIDFRRILKEQNILVEEPDRIEYGDFQTNPSLAQKVAKLLIGKNIHPTIIIEPTCGKGNFIVASLKTFNNLEKIIGVEIYKPYIWQTKFAILEYYLMYPQETKPIIELYHKNVFDFQFDKLIPKNKHVLVIGNPPWVTNSMLSSLGSTNLPQKSNFKNHNGFDAITGKGNFDIGEFISLMMIRAFSHYKGEMAFLVKNSVVKNIVYDQKRNNYQLSKIEKYVIDAKQEFNVAVDACLLFLEFNNDVEFDCNEFDFYTQRSIKKFGWVNGDFVADIQNYNQYSIFDGYCPFVWRQGLKHDCSKIMELEPQNGHYINGNGEKVDLENELVFGLLKSSDLKLPIIQKSRKVTIVTQKKIGQDTSFIRESYPLTWEYLSAHKSDFDNRKSSIYKNKPDFSIFGIGDYSFAPYKVAISGMYKTSKFSLILPNADKPVMLDDTCYFIGFNNKNDAYITQLVLNSKPVQWFIQSIIFWDSKRAITKDVLSRLDLRKIVQHLQFEDLDDNNPKISEADWKAYCQKLRNDR